MVRLRRKRAHEKWHKCEAIRVNIELKLEQSGKNTYKINEKEYKMIGQKKTTSALPSKSRKRKKNKHIFNRKQFDVHFSSTSSALLRRSQRRKALWEKCFPSMVVVLAERVHKHFTPLIK